MNEIKVVNRICIAGNVVYYWLLTTMKGALCVLYNNEDFHHLTEYNFVTNWRCLSMFGAIPHVIEFAVGIIIDVRTREMQKYGN